MVADAALVSLAWLGAYALRRALDPVLGFPINPFERYLHPLPLIVAPWIFTCWVFGIYAAARMKTVVDELQTLVRGVALGMLVVSAIGFFFKELSFGRFVVLTTGGLCLVFQGVSRVFFHRLDQRLRRSGECDVSALIVGAGVTGIRLLQKIQDHPEIGYRVVGFLDDEYEDGKEIAGLPVLGDVGRLREIATEQGVSEVFIAMPSLRHTRMLSLVLDCEDQNLTFRVVTNLFEVLTAGTPVDLVDDLPLVQLGRQRVHPLYEPLKRAADVVVASLGLLLTAPIMLWCAWRIRREDGGPALFRQERIGRGGRPIRIHKFRTMFMDVEPYAEAPRRRADPRVTPFGHFLRSSSLDELPQLFDVLRGDMSLVGPRPEMPFIVETYDAWQHRRLSVKPGITGLWQILGRKDLPMHENLQYDFYYIRNRSLTLDLSLLLRTAGAVLSKRGAF